jgi:uncharacterized damage-inducible protein DinB
LTAKTAQETLSTKLIGRWEQTGRKLATLAAEFPEEKYESRPVEGVRTFGEVLRHVAFWNQYVADSARGKKADDSANELPEAQYPAKASMIEALNRTSADAAAALREHQASLDPETAEMAVMFIEHTCEHYGQLVMYARWAGIVPPASRT